MVPQVLTKNAHRAHGRLTLVRECPNLPRSIPLPHVNQPKLDSNNCLGPCMPTLLTVHVGVYLGPPREQ